MATANEERKNLTEQKPVRSLPRLPSESIRSAPRVDHGGREKNITIRLSGAWLVNWERLVEANPGRTQSELTREFLSLGFHVASLDDSGQPVEVILRTKDAVGKQLPDVDLVEYCQLETFLKWRESRKSDYRE